MKLLMKCAAMLMAVTLCSCGSGTNFKNSDNTQVQHLNKSEENKESSASYSTADSTSVQPAASNILLQSGNPSPNTDWDKKIIKTANVTLELNDFKTFNTTIHNSVRRYRAYIASEQQQQNDSKIENVITIKVPVAQFEDLMNALPSDGVKVLEKRINTDDVTGEIVDTKARTEAKKQVRDQYIGLLKKSKNMKEIIEVQKEVNSVQEDIEAGSGRAELLTRQAAYSTVNLTYFQNIIASPDSDNSSPAFSIKLKEAFNNGVSVLSGLLLVTVTIWPMLLAGLVIWFLVKKYVLKQTKLVKKEQ